MEKMVEPLPSEGDEATITAMSPLAVVGRYLSTNSAKSTFLRNTGFAVKAISSKLPHDQIMQAQNNVISALQTQVHSLTETLCETRTTIVWCHQDMHGFENRLSHIYYVVQEPRRNEGGGYGAPSTIQHENVIVRSNELSFWTSGGAFICQTVNFYANLPFVL